MKMPSFVALTLLLAIAAPAAAAPASSSSGVTVAGVTFAPVPKNWTAQPASSQMRAAQWTVAPPKADKDAPGLEPGEVVVFYFGSGQGGGPKDNIERWQRRMQAADGSPVTGEVSQRVVDGMRLHVLVAYGTYAAGMPMPGFKPTLKPDYGLVGVVIETREGNVFVRFTGPKALVKANLEAFETWLAASKKATGADAKSGDS
ncbi:MAG: hypothetical protein AAGK14_15600 [Verrucomicrobiota bacterium]